MCSNRAIVWVSSFYRRLIYSNFEDLRSCNNSNESGWVSELSYPPGVENSRKLPPRRALAEGCTREIGKSAPNQAIRKASNAPVVERHHHVQPIRGHSPSHISPPDAFLASSR